MRFRAPRRPEYLTNKLADLETADHQFRALSTHACIICMVSCISAPISVARPFADRHESHPLSGQTVPTVFYVTTCDLVSRNVAMYVSSCSRDGRFILQATASHSRPDLWRRKHCPSYSPALTIIDNVNNANIDNSLIILTTQPAASRRQRPQAGPPGGANVPAAGDKSHGGVFPL